MVCKRASTAEALCRQVDVAMAEVWDKRGLRDLWDLNCLQYAGAVVVTERMGKAGVDEVRVKSLGWGKIGR